MLREDPGDWYGRQRPFIQKTSRTPRALLTAAVVPALQPPVQNGGFLPASKLTERNTNVKSAVRGAAKERAIRPSGTEYCL